MTKKDTVKREVIHLLCISPMAHSKLSKALNEDVSIEVTYSMFLLDGVQ